MRPVRSRKAWLDCSASALLAAFGDVVLDRHETQELARLGFERLDLQLDPVLAAVLAPVEQLAQERLTRIERRAQARQLARVGAFELQERARALAQHLGHAVAGDALETRR